VFICNQMRGRPVCFVFVSVGRLALVCFGGRGVLYDRIYLFTSKDYGNVVVVVYYLSLTAPFCCSASVGMYWTRYSISSVLFMPNAPRRSSTVSRNSWSHLIWKVLSFVITINLSILYVQSQSVRTILITSILICTYKSCLFTYIHNISTI